MMYLLDYRLIFNISAAAWKLFTIHPEFHLICSYPKAICAIVYVSFYLHLELIQRHY